MAQDIKVIKIQVEQIEYPAPLPVSGDTHIPVNAKLRYTEGFALDNDYDLVYKSYLDSLVGVENLTTSELDSTALDAEYPLALAGFEVLCPAIIDNPLIYKKSSIGWFSIPLGSI